MTLRVDRGVAKIEECLTVEKNFHQSIEQTMDRYSDPAPEDIEQGA